MRKTIGEKLRMLRISRNYTQEDLGHFTHMNRASYANYELDRRTPTIFFLIDIADLYGISVDYLVRTEYAKLPIPFSAEERKLLISYRALDSDKRQAMLSCSSFLCKANRPNYPCPFLNSLSENYL